MPSPIEHERRFLAADDTWRARAGDPRVITQGWLVHDDGVQVRVRAGQGWGSMACKVALGAPANGRRIELESEIEVDHARTLLERCQYRLEKIRWCVREDGHTYDVDEYLGDLAGIVTVEIEDPADDFVVPSWIGREVTGEAAWSNGALARDGRPETFLS